LKDYIRPIILDHNKEETIHHAFATVSEILKNEGKKLMAVINNAGIAELRPMEILTKEDFDYIFASNTYGPIAVSQAFIPLLKEWNGKGWAQIMFTTTIGVYMQLPFNGAYAASKMALEQFAAQGRLELKRHKIHISVVQPGSFKTDIFGKLNIEKFLDNKDYGEVYQNFSKNLKSGAHEKMHAPVEVIAKDIYVALFSYLPPDTITSGWDCLVISIITYLLPEQVFDKICPMQYVLGMNKLF